MLLDTTGQRDLLAYLCTGGGGQLDFGEISFYTEHTATSRRRTNVDEEQFVLSELRDLGLLLVLSLDTEESTE